MLTLDKVFDASNVLKEVIRPTACIHAPKVNPENRKSSGNRFFQGKRSLL